MDNTCNVESESSEDLNGIPKKENDFIKKIDAEFDSIVMKQHNELLDIWKKGERTLLDVLDIALARFEISTKGQISANKKEAQNLIHDAFEDFGMKAWLAKYQANGQVVFDLENIEYDTIRNFRVYIEEQKIEIRAKFAKIYEIMEQGKQELLQD